jgi:rhomboid protease GluP
MGTESQRVYRPRRGGKQVVSGIAMLVLGGLAAFQQWPKPLMQVPPGAGSPAGNLLLDLGAGVLILIGLRVLLAILRGVPRLTVDEQGLVMQSLFGTRPVAWERLGTFSLAIAYAGRRGRTRYKAIAPILDPSGNPTRRSFSIPDAFEVPVATLLDDLRAWRGDTDADATPLVAIPAGAERSFGVSGIRWPWLTALVLAIFVVVFLMELRFAATLGQQTLSPMALIALGGLSRTLVESGQWYRLLTAPFLHAGWPHLIFNGIAFALAGYALERLVGRAWMFCIFAAGAIAGSLTSLALLAPSTVSVGASGAIMAMLVALFLTSFRLPPGRAKSRIQIRSAQVAIPALIPASQGAAAMHVDYGAHFGGALIGLVLGLLLVRTWRDAAPLPGFRTGAATFAAIATLLFATSAYAVAQRYPSYEILADLIPAARYPHGAAQTASRSASLLAAYPRDPRSHTIAAVLSLRRGDKAGAERELRTALSLAETSAFIFGPAFANTIRAALADTILEEGRRAEAAAVAHEACIAEGGAVPAPQVMTALQKTGLCGGTGRNPS